jgi:hypothetical protein
MQMIRISIYYTAGQHKRQYMFLGKFTVAFIASTGVQYRYERACRFWLGDMLPNLEDISRHSSISLAAYAISSCCSAEL